MTTWILVTLWIAACMGLLAGQVTPLPEAAIAVLFAVSVGAASALYYLGMQEEP